MKKNSIAVALTMIAILVSITSCAKLAGPLNLEKYLTVIQQSTPLIAATQGITTRAWEEDKTHYVNAVFRTDADAVVSINTGITQMDALIDELNTVVTADNKNASSGEALAAAGTISLPVFGDSITLDYKLNLSENKYAAYRMAVNDAGEAIETVVLYNQYTIVWPVGSSNNVNDHYIFYGTRNKTTGQITVKFALYANNVTDSSFAKHWMCEIQIPGSQAAAEKKFQVRSAWGGVENFAFFYSVSVAGDKNSQFVAKVQGTAVNTYVVDSNYAEVAGADPAAIAPQPLDLFTDANMPKAAITNPLL
ncbi:MAG: hypothetical protein AB1798_09840 [Spirochaetota bacterium]